MKGVDMAKKKLTKADIIEFISSETDENKKSIHRTIDLVFDQIKEALVSGKSVELRGFGTFEVRQRKGRARARNPKTGEIVSVKPHGVAAFRPGQELKQDVWNIDRQPK